MSPSRVATGADSASSAESPALRPPPIVFNGRRWPSDELAAIAAGWLDYLHASIPRTAGLTAMLMSNHPHAVALFFALSSLSLPVAIFPADARAWRSSPSLPARTPVFVPPGRSALAKSLFPSATRLSSGSPALSRTGGGSL